MPYINPEAKAAYWEGQVPRTAGELNYHLTVQILDYLGDRPNYQKYNEVIGVLECAKLELYRRMVAPYEDGKRLTNGDVYPDGRS